MTVADLKNNLSRYLRDVRAGEDLTVVSRDVPVARIVPLEAPHRALDVRLPAPGTPSLAQVPLPPPLRLKSDIVDLLLTERGER